VHQVHKHLHKPVSAGKDNLHIFPFFGLLEILKVSPPVLVASTMKGREGTK
jgi:hypothetical protein